MRCKYYYLFLVLVLVLVSLGTLSCQSSTGSMKKSIVVTYSILGSIVEELVGDKADVTVSVPNGLDPHEWEPSARNIEAINKADLVIENGLGLEGGLERTLEEARKNGVKFFTVSDYIDIRYVGPGEGIPSDDPDQAIGAPDPHLWTDPLTVKSMVSRLATELQQTLNLNVTGNAQSLEGRLDDLDREIAAIVSTIPQSERKLVTGHESMGYFAERYDFKLVGVIIPSLSTQAEVSAADLAALKKVITDNRVKAIFTELGTSPAVAEAVGKETGVQVIELNTHTLPVDNSYFTFLRNMAMIITNALE